MSSEKWKNATCSSAEPRKPITCETINDAMAKIRVLEDKQLDSLIHLGALHGIKIFEDTTGMMCGPNEYIMFVGGKLYEKLKARTKEANES